MRYLYLTFFGMVFSSYSVCAQENVQLTVSNLPNGAMSFMASTSLDVNCSSVLPAVLNRDTYPIWWYNLESVKTLKNKSQAYWHSHVPWPVQDRDFITQDKVTQDEKTLAVTYSTLAINSDEIPVHPKRVRLDTLTSRLTVTPEKDGQCQVVIEAMAKPGGMIPQWAANLIAGETPKQSLVNLKRLIESKQTLPVIAPESFAAIEMAKLKMMPH